MWSKGAGYHILNPVIGREAEMSQVIQTLSRRKKNNPALIGEAGVGKTVIVEKLAQDGFDPVYGARPLRREVERQLENRLAMKIVRGECTDGSRLKIDLSEGEIRFRVD